ncbi:acyl carrier protein [Streptomyces sp. NPDC056061]|uniref:acyl carrier protein n=1 Tax=Streptomyces sp. NPDC056061 TaxID=3345700 RepID=UPI0035D85C2B
MKGDRTINESEVPPPQPADDSAKPTAEEIAEICSTVIGVDIPPEADLFAFGLHSLNLVRIVGAIDVLYGVRLTALDIHDHPTALALALRVGAGSERIGHD